MLIVMTINTGTARKYTEFLQMKFERRQTDRQKLETELFLSGLNVRYSRVIVNTERFPVRNSNKLSQ